MASTRSVGPLTASRGQEALFAGEEDGSGSEEGEAQDLCPGLAEPPSRGKARTGLLGVDVLRTRRFGIPIWRVGLCILLELLFCLFLSHACVRSGAARWTACTAWACFALSLLLRGAIVSSWQSRALGDGLLAALYMLSSSLPFLVYISLQYAMYSAASHVSVHPEAFLNRVDGNCTKAYEPPPVCDGAAEAYRSPHACCLVYRHTLHQSSQELVRPFGDFLAWASVLVVALVWKDVPFVPVAPADNLFASGLWLEALDAVAFSGFLEHKHATYPALGIDLVTFRNQPKDRKLLDFVWFLWLFAFITALLSRGIYAALRFSGTPWTKAGDRSLTDMTEELLRSIRLLDESRARTLVSETIRVQSESYRDAESEEDGTPVLVDAPPTWAVWGLAPPKHHTQCHGRKGWAEMIRPGQYVVEFADGYRPRRLDLPVERLEPCFSERLRMLGPGSCRGWGDPDHLVRGAPLERFNRRAKVLDAIRALLCLELPFLTVRLALEAGFGGRCSVWLLKNLVCATLDIMMIAACGNEAAKCLGSRPLRFVSDLVGGAPPGRISAEAEGLHRVAADPPAGSLRSRYQRDIERLTQHKAWLTLECEKAEEQAAALGTEEAVLAARVPYEAELRRLELDLARAACQLRVPADG